MTVCMYRDIHTIQPYITDFTQRGCHTLRTNTNIPQTCEQSQLHSTRVFRLLSYQVGGKVELGYGHTRVPLTAALFIRLTPPLYWFRVPVINFEIVSQLLLNSTGENSEALPIKM